MPNDLTIIPLDQFSAPSTLFAKSTVDVAKFAAGIQASFAILTIKGKTWGIRYRGVTQQLTAPNPMAGNALMPVQFLDVVVVDAAESISKVYYIAGYVEGQRTPPDCWSANGIVPDPAAPHRQSATCRGCRHNVFGSKLGDSGQKGKACPDNKRLAVVPVSDIKNESFGGPVMLRLPPGSFQLYAEFVGKLAQKTYPPFAVACRLTFAPNEAYPKVVFTPLRPLNDAEAQLVLEVQQNPALERMLSDPAIGAMADDDDVQSGVAPAETLAPPPQQQAQPTLTPEQQKIADLEAALAQAKASATVQQPPPSAPVPPTPTPQAAPIHTGFGVAAPAPSQPVQQTTTHVASWGSGQPATPPPATQPTDDLAIPGFLKGQPQPEVLTPEQMQIRELQAKLATLEAKKPGRPRTKPVGPPATNGAAEPVTQASNPAGSGGFGTPASGVIAMPDQTTQQVQEPAEDPGVGNAIASRIANLVQTKTGS